MTRVPEGGQRDPKGGELALASEGEITVAVDDAGLVGKVMVTIAPLIVEPGGGAIGGSRQRRGAGGARDDFDREMVDRHDGVPFTPKAARRHDV